MRNNLLKAFNIIAGFASIVSMFYLLFTDEVNGKIALFAFCFFLLFACISLIYGINQFIKKENEKDHKKVSVFTTFETIDNTHGVFETYRVIQSKRMILSCIDQNFKWSGSKMPEISSDLQTIKQVKTIADNYDKAVLEFKRPLLFNETATVHFKAKTDDFDGSALPYLDYKVDTEINIIHYRVILRHKDNSYNKPAILSKKAINSDHPTNYERFGSVPFDPISKSYQYNLITPEIGYFYRLEWEK